MSTSTQVSQLKINKLTKQQYSSIIPSDTELYFVMDEDDMLPSQEGQEGKFLTTDGTDTSWANIPTEIPTQSGNTGKFLTTDGTDTSWANIPTEIPDQSGNTGKFLTTDGTDTSWANIPTEIPTQSGNTGKYLYTNGTTPSWANLDLTQSSSALATSGTVTLSDNSIYTLTASGAITFSLPSISDTTKFHQIMVQFKMNSVYTLNVGTSHYFYKETPDLSTAGSYNLVWEYDNVNGYWTFGAIPKN